ncbi:DSBA oxidoreductase [Marinosulfonomonas sp. PRT-SC04]|nr:DSBA oxidoreductase [Marinosulfonomonas sp. PRT-SC04]
MKRFILHAAIAPLALMTPALATDIIDMTDTERDVFRAEVRAYLMENPEVLLEAIAVLDERQAVEETASDSALLLQNAEAIYNDGASFVGGNPDGDITIVEFADYNCGYCKKAHPEVAELLASDGNIRLIYKEFPILGPDSLTSAKFAMATLMVSGPEAYGKVNNALMNKRGAPSNEALVKLANSFDLDADAVIAKMDSPEVMQIIQANRALGQALKISGTPTFIMGDQLVRGYLPLENMRDIVEQVRAANPKD